MKIPSQSVLVLLLAGWLAPSPQAQTTVPAPATGTFDAAAADMQRQLQESIAELNALREEMAGEKIPLGRRLGELESDLSGVRREYQQTIRLLDSRTLDISNLSQDMKRLEEEASYLSNLLGEYVRNFESRLHIAEVHRFKAPLEAAKLAMESSSLTDQQIFEAQAALLDSSIGRLEDALGGSRFDGTAVDSTGVVREGTFVMIGPAALFRTKDGGEIGTAQERLGSVEPSIIPFTEPLVGLAADQLFLVGEGRFPLDPTLGNAHKMEAADTTLLEEVQKGGPVMIPIFVMAGAALLVALYKWMALAFLRRPSKKQLAGLYEAVSRRDEEDAVKRASSLRGPVGRMLRDGVAHLSEPRELIEEVMYENVLTTKLKTQRLLPFISICAASAPLLGLLGTVTGIITTFKLITVFGSGDVKMLSGGISEALITTKFGLIVAIPSLLLHAFLSRKARGVIGAMETSAVAFLNQVSKAKTATVPEASPGPLSDSGSDITPRVPVDTSEVRDREPELSKTPR